MPGLKNLKPLKAKEAKNIRKLIKDQWDAELDEDIVFFMNTKEQKIFISNREIATVDFDKFNINTIGLYMGELYKEELRPSIEGSQLIAKTAKKNILEINEDQAKEYMKGNDIEKETGLEGYIILKSKKDILGATRKKEKKLMNFFPKIRRLP